MEDVLSNQIQLWACGHFLDALRTTAEYFYCNAPHIFSLCPPGAPVCILVSPSVYSVSSVGGRGVLEGRSGWGWPHTVLPQGLCPSSPFPLLDLPSSRSSQGLHPSLLREPSSCDTPALLLLYFLCNTCCYSQLGFCGGCTHTRLCVC